MGSSVGPRAHNHSSGASKGVWRVFLSTEAMPEVVGGWLASAAVNFACDKLSTAIAEQTTLAIDFNSDLSNLRDTMESMNAVFKDAEKRSIKKESAQERLWLKRLKHAALDISDMMDDYQDIEATPKVRN